MTTLEKNRCYACNKLFCCADCCTDHIRKKHPGRESKCPLCRDERLMTNNLDNQEFICHIIFNHLPLGCRLCGRNFKNSDDLRCLGICDRRLLKPVVLTSIVDRPIDDVSSPETPSGLYSTLSNKKTIVKGDYNGNFGNFVSPPELTRKTSTPMHVVNSYGNENFPFKTTQSPFFGTKTPTIGCRSHVNTTRNERSKINDYNDVHDDNDVSSKNRNSSIDDSTYHSFSSFSKSTDSNNDQRTPLRSLMSNRSCVREKSNDDRSTIGDKIIVAMEDINEEMSVDDFDAVGTSIGCRSNANAKTNEDNNDRGVNDSTYYSSSSLSKSTSDNNDQRTPLRSTITDRSKIREKSNDDRSTIGDKIIVAMEDINEEMSVDDFDAVGTSIGCRSNANAKTNEDNNDRGVNDSTYYSSSSLSKSTSDNNDQRTPLRSTITDRSKIREKSNDDRSTIGDKIIVAMEDINEEMSVDDFDAVGTSIGCRSNANAKTNEDNNDRGVNDSTYYSSSSLSKSTSDNNDQRTPLRSTITDRSKIREKSNDDRSTIGDKIIVAMEDINEEMSVDDFDAVGTSIGCRSNANAKTNEDNNDRGVNDSTYYSSSSLSKSTSDNNDQRTPLRSIITDRSKIREKSNDDRSTIGDKIIVAMEDINEEMSVDDFDAVGTSIGCRSNANAKTNEDNNDRGVNDSTHYSSSSLSKSTSDNNDQRTPLRSIITDRSKIREKSNDDRSTIGDEIIDAVQLTNEIIGMANVDNGDGNFNQRSVKELRDSTTKRVRFSDEFEIKSDEIAIMDDASNVSDSEEFFEARQSFSEIGSSIVDVVSTSSALIDRENEENLEKEENERGTTRSLEIARANEKIASPILSSSSSSSSSSTRVVMMVVVDQNGVVDANDLAPLIDSGLKRLKSVVTRDENDRQEIGATELPTTIANRDAATRIVSIDSYTSVSTVERYSASDGIANVHRSSNDFPESNDFAAGNIFSAVAQAMRTAFRNFAGGKSSKSAPRELVSQTEDEAAPSSNSDSSTTNVLTNLASALVTRPAKRSRDVDEIPTWRNSETIDPSNDVRSPMAKRPRGWYKIRPREPIARMRNATVTSPRGISSERQCFRQGSLSVGDTILPLPSRAHQSTQTD